MSAWGPRRARARRRKVVAIVAAGVVALAGVTVTSLATWFDEEWVSAGVNGVPGFSASRFAIEQQTLDDAGTWTTHKDQADPGVVSFGSLASSLAPGSTAYGWVAVRTAADSTVGGTITLRSAYTAGDSLLGDALVYGARVMSDPAECAAGSFDAAGTELVPSGSALDTDGATFRVEPGTAGAAGATQWVCIELEFPAGAADPLLQGQTLDALWVLEAQSD